ncbi:hypothetical protein EYF80_041776 [Liparis tanakae]|uniref:Uncharacterized protein n=1 Tax=Liparis tanakae TaxID=230148 RepID=A0A4Z2G5E8_9TELE|nr:hypothetical protein EYF80_041776 [Liparis tanakae]
MIQKESSGPKADRTQPPHTRMETAEGPELCFPLLLNESCRKPQSDGVFVNVLLSFISLHTASLNLLIIISISHFRQR